MQRRFRDSKCEHSTLNVYWVHYVFQFDDDDRVESGDAQENCVTRTAEEDDDGSDAGDDDGPKARDFDAAVQRPADRTPRIWHAHTLGIVSETSSLTR